VRNRERRKYYKRVEGIEGRDGNDEKPRDAKIPSPLTLAILVMMVRSGAEEVRKMRARSAAERGRGAERGKERETKKRRTNGLQVFPLESSV